MAVQVMSKYGVNPFWSLNLPNLTDDEELLPLHHSLVNHGLNSSPDFRFVLVHVGRVDVPVPGTDGRLHGLRGDAFFCLVVTIATLHVLMGFHVSKLCLWLPISISLVIWIRLQFLNLFEWTLVYAVSSLTFQVPSPRTGICAPLLSAIVGIMLALLRSMTENCCLCQCGMRGTVCSVWKGGC